MTLRRFSLAFFLALFGAAPTFAQMEHPVLAKGFAADKLYQFGGLDSINTFNGNLVISIPLGPRFAVNGPLSYGLTLTYNSKVWDYVKGPNDCPALVNPSDCPLLVYRAEPTHRSNAGLGWLLTLGRVVRPEDTFNPDPDAGFQTSDGAIHKFYDVLHPDEGHVEPFPAPTTTYSRDNTYLRSTGVILPDGTSETIVDFPDGTSETMVDSKVTSIKDPYGNSVAVHEYTSSDELHQTPCFVTPGETISSAYELHDNSAFDSNDTRGRSQYICFTDQPIPGTSIQQDNFEGHQSVRHVITVAPNGQSSVYTFNYVFPHDDALGANGDGVQRGCHSHLYLESPRVMVPLLGSIDLPDGSSFRATYNVSETSGNCEQGTLASLQLPTGGELAYAYKLYEIPSNVCQSAGAGWYSKSTGVQTRKLINRDKTVFDGDTTATWTYDHVKSVAPAGTQFCGKTEDVTTKVDNPEEAMGTTIVAPDQSMEVHWYSVWPFEGVSPNGFTNREFSLPLNHLMPNESYFGSIEHYEFNPKATTDADKYHHVRTTYVQYERDGAPSGACKSDIDEAVNSECYDANRREFAERVVYDDDMLNGVVRYADSEQRDFDGFGHYRETTSSGNFSGSTTIRTTRTEFNPGTDASGNRGGNFAFGPTDTWFLNSYTDKCAKDGVTSIGNGKCSQLAQPYAHESFCFDGLFLKARRSERGPSLTGTVDTSRDLLVTFHNDGHGNADKESYFGGDLNPIGGTNACDGSGSTPEYVLTHEYQYGVLANTKFVSGTSSETVLDQTIGAAGVPESSKDASGLRTAYDYDTMGRLLTSIPDTTQGVARGGWTKYQYDKAGTLTNARVTIDNLDGPNGNSIAHEEYEYDGLGRLIMDKVRMPDASGSLSTRRTTYNLMGWKATVSELEASSIPTHVTSFDYDSFGRPTSITSPDQKRTTIVYHGVSSQDKTLQVFKFPQGDRTQTPGESDVKTTETYDQWGRLIGVDKPGLSATYGYDTGDRLTSVQLSGGGQRQNRSFLYDYSGLLLKETHPESQPVTYSDYDSRGHAHRRTVQPKNPADATEQRFDLKFKYDFAERMTEVHSIDAANNDLLLKQYVFGSSSNSTNWADGKLIEATRHNRQAVSPTDVRDVRVTERYVYGERDGNISQKTTCVDTVPSPNDGPCDVSSPSASKPVFTTQYQFDPDSRVSSITYPTCVGCSVAGPDRTITNQYTNGFLTNVSTPQTVIGSLSYSANTTLNTIAYASPGVMDTITPDPNAMPRPAAIEFSGWVDPSSCLPRISGQPADVQVANNTTANLSVIATGDPLTYQWYEVDLAKTAHIIDGATAATFTTAPITGTHFFRVKVTNSCGPVVSRDATVSVSSTGGTCSVVTAPPTVYALAGSSATLTAQTTGSAAGLTWYQGASPSKSQPFPKCQGSATCQVSESDGTQFWVSVPSTSECSESDSGTITVTWGPACDPPVIDSFVDANAGVSSAGAAHLLTVTPHCVDSSTQYAWAYKILPATTELPFTPSDPPPSPSPGPIARVSTNVTKTRDVTTTYYVTVSNSSGTKESDPLTVHVLRCPDFNITSQPTDQWVSFGATAHLVVGAGTGSYTYDWYQIPCGDPTKDHTKVNCADPNIVSGDPHSNSVAQNRSVPFYDTDAIEADSYFWVRVNGPNNCSADSRKVVVKLCPRILTQPQDVTVTKLMNRAVLGVTMMGDGLLYQWYRGEASDTSSPVVNGNDPILQINVDQTTKFWIRVIGPCGSLDSHSATVTWCDPPEVTQQPDPYKLINSGLGQDIHSDRPRSRPSLRTGPRAHGGFHIGHPRESARVLDAVGH